MYLKRLDIQGFKSFAEKISLEFNSGITSVVGPNGSGKSNIADAIRWVLGEQSAKTLRGSRMEDVIFAGTEHRKPVGFAEVSLTIDNSDGKLSVEYSEITVTRRVFRSGESEYLINKTPCRLKDIHELFMDTGLGRDGYSIIGQGRVDEILSTRSEDRRHIFEEASGIMKYKVRKQEAEKKLELTEQNLLRINDIIVELEKQLEPLQEQAETAKKYLNLRESLKELEVNVFIDNIEKIKAKLMEQDEQYKSIRESIDTETGKLEEITESNKVKNDLMKSLSEKLNNSRQEFFSLEGSLERCQSEIRVIDERVSNLQQNIARIDGEIGEFNQKLSSFSEDEKAKKDKLVYLEKRHADYSQKLNEAQSKLDEVLSSLSEGERKIENLKTGIMDKLDIQSDKKTQINYVKTHLDNLSKRQKSIDQEIYQIMLENDRENTKKEDLQESIRRVKLRIKEAGSTLEQVSHRKKEADAALADLRKKQNTLKGEIQFKNSRFKMLSDMEHNLEGYHRSVKNILQACQQNPSLGKGIHGALAQLLTVDKKYETAIEMALGGALQNIVTTSEEDAKKAIDFLKKNNLGRATFLPISSVKGKALDGNYVAAARRQKGFCGIASELVECGPEYKGILLSLLGRVVVVEDLEAGIQLARQTGYAFRIVTLEGDLLNTSGSMTGGSAESKGAGILSRHREIQELKDEVAALKQEDASIEGQISEAIAILEEIERKISAVQDELKNDELIRIRDESHLAQVEENIHKAHVRTEMLNNEKAQLVRQEQETEIELRKYMEELKAVEEEMEEAKRIIAEHQDRHREDQSVRDMLHADITDYKISVNSILESMEGVKETLSRLTEERESMARSIKRKEDEKNRNHEEIAKLSLSREGLLKSIRGYEEEKTGKILEIDRISEDIKILEEELSDAIHQINQQNKTIMLLQEEFGRIEVRKTKLEAEMETLQNRMWDEYEITYNNALEIRKDIGSIGQAQKRINELKSQIKELGPVNVGAIEEYLRTKERFEFMSVQKNDMEQAKEKLHRVIYEMTAVMKRQFLEQFRLINENFGLVFKELFDGGRAELILVDKENVLESGIEIEVQPPGKKLQNMMLLSGGERAFTAIALLFSILRLRPTPFCVLDEIEAALDDANVHRFAQYIKRFAVETQFILITHRKGTMEGSDMLYGVTMQEHGVSKVVSMRLGEQRAG